MGQWFHKTSNSPSESESSRHETGCQTVFQPADRLPPRPRRASAPFELVPRFPPGDHQYEHKHARKRNPFGPFGNGDDGPAWTWPRTPFGYQPVFEGMVGCSLTLWCATSLFPRDFHFPMNATERDMTHATAPIPPAATSSGAAGKGVNARRPMKLAERTSATGLLAS